MLKTLLINPPYSLEERYGGSLKSFGAMTEPMGLAYLSGSLESNQLPVEILDAPAMGFQIDEVADKVNHGSFHLVGITFLTPMFDVIRDLTHRIKESCHRVKIIVGGPHPTALPERTLNELPDIDFVCVGEGEKTIVDVIKYLDGENRIEKINGLVYRKGKEIVKNPPRKFESDLDSIPKPTRHLLPMEKYQLTASRTKGSTHCPTIIVARGCPFDCQYCSHPFGRTFRHHSVDRVIEELRELKQDYNVNQVNLEADTLTINKRFIKELCEGIVQSGLDIRWTCESRVDTVTESMLRYMKNAGCWQISYGVESGSQRLLDLIHKDTTKTKVTETFALTKKIGITIRGFFMLGLPTETAEESMETIQFAKELDPLWAQFTLTVPYPGTPMFKQLDSEGKIMHYRWSHYNTWGGWANRQLPFVSEGRTEEELKSLQKRAMRMYFLRPKVLVKSIKSISSISDIMKYIHGFIVLVKTAFEKNREH
jgi:anaerobic magnesium-protoporphyrin IX monomethyl ester cyclase